MSGALRTRIELAPQAACPCIPVYLLPCYIASNGSAPVAKHFVVKDNYEVSRAAQHSDGPSPKQTCVARSQVAHFRGRKLLGTKLALPNGYVGSVYSRGAERTVPKSVDLVKLERRETRCSAPEQNDVDDVQDLPDAQEMEELSIWTIRATFDTLLEFGNNAIPDSNVSDWLSLSHALHDTPSIEKSG